MLRVMGPRTRTDVFQEPMKKRGESNGMRMSETREFTRLVIAAPMTTAIERVMTLNSLKNLMRSLSIDYSARSFMSNAISTAERPASQPFFWVPRERTWACSRFSVVRTPKMTGILYSRLTVVRPLATLSAM